MKIAIDVAKAIRYMKILCIFKHKDGEKRESYIDEIGTHYMSNCLRCGKEIFYPTLEEELWELEQQLDIPYKYRFYKTKL